MKLFLQKNAKFTSAGGSAPRPPRQAPPLRLPGYAPGMVAVSFDDYKERQEFFEKLQNCR